GGQDLAFARSDAELIAGSLSARGNTELLLLPDEQATVEKVTEAIQQLVAATNEDDLALVFFAGRGWMNPQAHPNLDLVEKSGWMMSGFAGMQDGNTSPVTHRGLSASITDLKNDQQAPKGILGYNKLFKILDEARGHVIVISDACYFGDHEVLPSRFWLEGDP